MHNSIELPAIVLAAFGTSSPVARKVYGEVELRVRDAYPGHEICWAYLSPRIVNKQRSLGIHLPTLTDALCSLRESGIEQAVVQPVLVVPGEEFSLVKSIKFSGISLAVGDPLLSSDADISAVIAAIAPYIEADIPNVLVCHGNKKHPHYNVPLLRLKAVAESAFSNLIVASIEGEPGPAPLARAREMSRKHGAVTFIPFMITAGEHIVVDVMGDHPEAWRHIIGASHSKCLEPLGRNARILKIYLNHIETAMHTLSPVLQND